MATETQQVRDRIAELVEWLRSEYPDRPPQLIARALTAKGCEVMLAANGGGLMETVRMTDQAQSLLGHWTPETVETFIERMI